MEEINKIYRLNDGHYFEMFTSDEGYYYSIYDQTGLEVDGGLLEYGDNEETQNLMDIRNRLAEFSGYLELKDESLEEVSQTFLDDLIDAREQPKKEENIRVIICKPNMIAEEEIITNQLESLQREVDGYIEVLGLEDGICMVCNEEGKIENKPLNRAIRDSDGKIVDVVAGDFFICAETEDGEFRSLTDDEFKKYFKMFEYPENVLQINGEIYSVPFDPNTKEMLKEKIINRLNDELKDYKESIIKLSNKEILDKSYETATKEEMPYRFEVMDFDKEELQALDKYDGNLLGAFYDEWLDVDVQLNEVLEPAIERATKCIFNDRKEELNKAFHNELKKEFDSSLEL